MLNSDFINISAYRFIGLESARLPQIKEDLLPKAKALDLKGTILLSCEGINLFLAGTEENINLFFIHLNTYPEFKALTKKLSPSSEQPFTRMLVRIKKEIISMGCPEIKPEQQTAPHLDPKIFKKWYQDKKNMLVLDTRNDYEVELGTFDDAIDLNIESFRDFPDAVKQLSDEDKAKPIITFCTGGIRCEKAAQYMLNHGFKEVYQLDGGILNYFEQCGGDHYHGECFVFDKRVAVNSQLQETQTTQCFACRMPLLPDQQSDTCMYCQSNPKLGKRAAERQANQQLT